MRLHQVCHSMAVLRTLTGLAATFCVTEVNVSECFLEIPLLLRGLSVLSCASQAFSVAAPHLKLASVPRIARPQRGILRTQAKLSAIFFGCDGVLVDRLMSSQLLPCVDLSVADHSERATHGGPFRADPFPLFYCHSERDGHRLALNKAIAEVVSGLLHACPIRPFVARKTLPSLARGARMRYSARKSDRCVHD